MSELLNRRPVSIRPTRPEDLDFVIQLERHEDNAPFIRHWPHQQHLAAIGDPNLGHFIVERSSDSHPVGYAILINLQGTDKSIEFKRLVIAEKGKGYGRAALLAVADFAFGELECHRLWLEVAEYNESAHQLYRRVGFIDEGSHREALKRGDKFFTLHVMSMLRQEYEKLK